MTIGSGSKPMRPETRRMARPSDSDGFVAGMFITAAVVVLLGAVAMKVFGL